MSTPRLVRIPRARPAASPGPEASPTDGSGTATPVRRVAGVDRRPNVAGAQRALRLAALYVAVLGALYVGFFLYDRAGPGGSASPEANGLLVFTGMFVVFALAGALYTLSPAPRCLEVGSDHVTVVGRWGRRRRLTSMDRLSVRSVRRYREGWLSSKPVELVEVWGEDTPVRGYLVEAELFSGARTRERGP